MEEYRLEGMRRWAAVRERRSVEHAAPDPSSRFREPPLAGRRIVHAVSGGIAAYKAAEVVSQLVQLGATVDVIMTAAAREFIQPLTFNALTRRPVHDAAFTPWNPDAAGHVTLAGIAEVLLVAPATANTLARLSLGLADDLLGMVALATLAPLLIAPAMEDHMWRHPATQEHIRRLQERGVTIVGPATGRLASGAIGEGRLAPPAQIVGATRRILGRNGALVGKRLVITAGGTHEPLDPVRYLGNRSSGTMGVALVEAALDAGATVTLIAGPMSQPLSEGVVATYQVETAKEMHDAVLRASTRADVLIMAAAVADFRPTAASLHKVKKSSPSEGWRLDLVQNPDILAAVNRPGLIKVGFAAETENLLENASAKLRRKGLAMIVANDAVATLGSSESTATVLIPGRAPQALPKLSKQAVARIVIDHVVALLSQGHGPEPEAA